MSEHLTLDELAELDAGLLARRRAAAATRHLADCDECTALADALHKTQQRLGDLGPVAMPPDVVARIDRTLRDAEATSGTDVVPDLGEVRARRLSGVPPWAYVAAAAVVVLAGVGIGIGTTRHDHHDDNHLASGLAAKPALVPTRAPQSLVQEATGRTYTPQTIGDLAPGLLPGASADALGAAPVPLAQNGPGVAGAGGSASSTSRAPQYTSTNKLPASAPPQAALAAPSVAAPLQRLEGSRAALLHCAAFITDTPNAAPLAADFGRWTNKKEHLHRVPSVVFVFADTDDASKLDVYVVAAACDETSLLDFQVLSRPH
ncbi:MAG TPA: hypothetical protein VHC43_16390 [Mycobacteriales bacterium]|nr:hypothetical protein [Mycobacteriales bacterium]